MLRASLKIDYVDRKGRFLGHIHRLVDVPAVQGKVDVETGVTRRILQERTEEVDSFNLAVLFSDSPGKPFRLLPSFLSSFL
jgi:hypothetical protein